MDCNYASAFSVLSSLYDIKIDFAAVEPELDENGDVAKEHRVNKQRITMAPALAKDLAEKLSDIVASYENRYGKIPEVLTVEEE